MHKPTGTGNPSLSAFRNSSRYTACVTIIPLFTIPRSIEGRNTLISYSHPFATNAVLFEDEGDDMDHKKRVLALAVLQPPGECGPSSEVISDSSKMYSQRSISTLSSTTGLVSASTYSSPKAFSDLIDPIHANSLRWPRMTGSRPPLGGLSTAETLIKRCRLGGEETFCLNLALKDPWVRLSLFDVTPPDGCPAPVKRSIPHQYPSP